MFPRVMAAMAIAGGAAWATWAVVALIGGEAAWGGPLGYLLMASMLIAAVGLSVAAFALLFANIDRLRPVAALVAAIGASAGLLTIAGAYVAGFVGLPIGSAALMLDLARLDVVGLRRARLHAAAGILSVISVAVLLATQSSTPGAVPYATLLVSAVAYAVSWITIGWSLRTGEWMPGEEPAASRP